MNGHEKLNLAFIANLFNNHPGLDPPSEERVVEVREETREERMFRNWINSLGVTNHVNYLYSDLGSGLVILQLEDTIRPGIVDWDNRVVTEKRMSRNRAVNERSQAKVCILWPLLLKVPLRISANQIACW